MLRNINSVIIFLAVISIFGCLFCVVYEPHQSLYLKGSSLNVNHSLKHNRQMLYEGDSNYGNQDIIIGMAQNTDAMALSIFCDSLRM